LPPSVSHETVAGETLSTLGEDLFQVCEGAEAKKNHGDGDGDRRRGEEDRLVELRIPSRPTSK
jgi:hypothetical protein